jgi:hypothetical protein
MMTEMEGTVPEKEASGAGVCVCVYLLLSLPSGLLQQDLMKSLEFFRLVAIASPSPSHLLISDVFQST